jgi:cyclic dehypoxanthinyl futalosine synthase
VLAVEQILHKIQETVDLGGTGILMQGGLHPDIGMEYITELLRAIRRGFPEVQVHSLSPAEIWHYTNKSGLSLEETLRKLGKAGLMSIPAGGAEILTAETRGRIAPAKTSTEAWLEVMETWHSLGSSSTATMMFGIRRALQGARRAPLAHKGVTGENRGLHGVYRLEGPAGQHHLPQEAPQIREGLRFRLPQDDGHKPHPP